MNKPAALLFVLILTVPLILTLPAHVDATSRTIVVPDDYSDIQTAINHANAGDTVFVRNGVYYTTFSSVDINAISISKSITLLGEDPRKTIIDGIHKEVDYSN